MKDKIKWMEEIATFLKSRVTGLMFTIGLFASFTFATFDHPTLVERLLLVISSLGLGWYLCFRYYEYFITRGVKAEEDSFVHLREATLHTRRKDDKK